MNEILGHMRWYGSLIWGIIIEIGMMVTPPMVIAMDTGFFGVKYKNGYEIVTVSSLAHLAYGFVLGLFIERYVKHKGNLIGAIVGAMKKCILYG